MLQAKYIRSGSCMVTANGEPRVVNEGEIVEMTENEMFKANVNKSFIVLNERKQDDSKNEDVVISTFVS